MRKRKIRLGKGFAGQLNKAVAIMAIVSLVMTGSLTEVWGSQSVSSETAKHDVNNENVNAPKRGENVYTCEIDDTRENGDTIESTNPATNLETDKADDNIEDAKTDADIETAKTDADIEAAKTDTNIETATAGTDTETAESDETLSQSDYVFNLDDFYVSEAFLLYGSSRCDDETGSIVYDESLEMIEAVDEEYDSPDTDDGFMYGDDNSVEAEDAIDENGDEVQGFAYRTRTTSQEGIDLIKTWEGFRSKAYKALSTEKYYTIGYGHNGPDVTADMVITKEQGEALLKSDVVKFENKLNSFVSTNNVFLSQNQFDALISFSYNVGTGWMSDSTIRRYILEGFDNHTDQDYKDALYMWRYSGGKVIQGLANRRVAEGNLFVKYKNYTESNGLRLTVESPRIITCKSPTTFTLKCEGGSGNYKYRIHSLFIYDGSEQVSVYDVSYGSNSAYSTSNTFQFTFYASGDYYIRFSVMDMTTYKTVSTGMYDMPLMVRDDRCPSVEKIVEDVAASCNRNCSTEYQKAKWLHDYIILNGQYDYSYTYCSAEGVLARGKGTCESYHRAYVMLLNKVGIANARVTGNGHVWTAVRMDGKWYQVDTTWDDVSSTNAGIDLTHLYFGLTDEIMKTVHSEHTANASRPCNSLVNNYFIKSGDITTYSDPYKNAILEGFDNGDTVVEVPYIANATNGYYDNVLMPLIVYELKQTDFGGRKVTIEYTGNSIIATESITAPIVKKAKLNLNGKTDLVFMVALTDDLKSSTTAYAELSCDGVKKKIYIKDAEKTGGLYDFTYALAAKQLRTPVTLCIYKNASTRIKLANYNTASVYEFKYSVEDYVDTIKGTSSDTKLKSMLDAMMNYGICAERYLEDSSDALPQTVSSVGYTQFRDYEYSITGTVPGIKYLGSSLLLEDSTSVRHYFEFENSADIDSFSFSVNGTELEKHASGVRCYVEIKNILPTEYDTMYKVTVSSSGNSMDISYGVYAYGERALFKTGVSGEIQNVMRAMYLYGQAADAYYR